MVIINYLKIYLAVRKKDFSEVMPDQLSQSVLEKGCNTCYHREVDACLPPCCACCVEYEKPFYSSITAPVVQQ